MGVRRVGPYDVDVSLRERLIDRPVPEVRIHFEAVNGAHHHTVALTPAFARTLARRLKKYADIADPKGRRR